MLSLHRKEIITCFLFLFGLSAEAQVRTKHQPNYDAKPIRFGYYVGFANTHYNVKFRPSFLEAANTNNPDGVIYAVSSPNTTAIRAGAMVNYYINDYFDFRFSPLNIAIYKRNITYVKDHVPLEDTQDDKAWLEIPMHVKYKSERRNNTRMYIFGGARWGFETNVVKRKGANKVSGNESLRTSDLALEYGVGLEFFREYFKVTPELHFSHGLFNMMKKDNGKHHLDHVKSLKTHSVSLIILFQ